VRARVSGQEPPGKNGGAQAVGETALEDDQNKGGIEASHVFRVARRDPASPRPGAQHDGRVDDVSCAARSAQLPGGTSSEVIESHDLYNT